VVRIPPEVNNDISGVGVFRKDFQNFKTFSNHILENSTLKNANADFDKI
jgi:hypothetical protein